MQIARPYATALFDLAQEQNALGDVEAGLVEINGMAAESADFMRFLRSPVINSGAKAQAVEALLTKGKAHPVVAKFVKVVARNGRLFALPTIIQAFRDRAAAARGEVTADVISAAPLSKAQLSTLAASLKAKIGKSVTINEQVDPSLIGGLVVKVGSQMIDSSIKTKLTAMKIAMKEVG